MISSNKKSVVLANNDVVYLWWQDKLKKAGAKTKKQKENVLKKQWGDLDEKDKWMDYYFDENGFVNRNKFLF